MTNDEQAAHLKAFTDDATARFHQTYYFHRDRTWFNTRWMGIPIYKCPTDLWIYQEIVHRTRPSVIVETGTASGGSALFFAQIGEHLGGVRVITVDITNTASAVVVERLPKHPAITYLAGSSTDPQIVDTIRSSIGPDDRVMVVLDSDHAMSHVRAELDLYAPMVTPGCYLVVEDTNVNGHPVYPLHGPGPMEALADFLPRHPEFEVDGECEKFMLTFNPGGYLRRR
jgi:cephalosporin hydroxylase